MASAAGAGQHLQRLTRLSYIGEIVMAKDRLTTDSKLVNKNHHASPACPAFITHLEEVRCWCECLARHDLDTIDMAPVVLRKLILALAESIEVAHQSGLEFVLQKSVEVTSQAEQHGSKSSVVPFNKES